MAPRTLKLNAHRTLTYYTPEDVAELQRQLEEMRGHLVAMAEDHRRLSARCDRLIEENNELRKEEVDDVLW